MSNRSSVRATKAGLSRDVQQKINSKYDPELAGQCLMWLRDSINACLEDGEEGVDFSIDGSQDNFSHVLHNGVILARMANVMNPGCIPTSKWIKPPKLAFKQMELIGLFIDQCKAFGVTDQESFQTVDLYEEQNLHQVLVMLQCLGRKAQAKGMGGFGPKESVINVRQFDEATLRSGDAVIGLQMGTNKGASQAGMTFGKQRMIND